MTSSLMCLQVVGRGHSPTRVDRRNDSLIGRGIRWRDHRPTVSRERSGAERASGNEGGPALPPINRQSAGAPVTHVDGRR